MSDFGSPPGSLVSTAHVPAERAYAGSTRVIVWKTICGIAVVSYLDAMGDFNGLTRVVPWILCYGHNVMEIGQDGLVPVETILRLIRHGQHNAMAVYDGNRRYWDTVTPGLNPRPAHYEAFCVMRLKRIAADLRERGETIVEDVTIPPMRTRV